MGVRTAVGTFVLSLIFGIGCAREPTRPEGTGKASPHGGVYTDAQFGFQICVPEGWYVQEQDLFVGSTGGSVELYGPSEGGFTLHLSIGVGKLPAPEGSAKQAMDDLWRQIQRCCSRCVLESRRSFTIGGVEAEEMIYGIPSWDLKSVQFLLLIGEASYFSIRGGGPWGDFPIETYRRIVSSFRSVGAR